MPPLLIVFFKILKYIMLARYITGNNEGHAGTHTRMHTQESVCLAGEHLKFWRSTAWLPHTGANVTLSRL